MAHTNYEDMLRDHETHLRRLEGEKGLFSANDGDEADPDAMFALIDAAAEAERQIIDRLKAIISEA